MRLQNNLLIPCTVISLILVQTILVAQTSHPDASLRLTPIWSRVADVFGEAGSIESAEFSPNGSFIVSGSKFDNSVIMWRTSDGVELWRQYTKGEIERVGWSADNKYVASCSEDRMVQVWDAQNGDLVKSLKHDQGIDGLAWSRAGSLLLTGEEETKIMDGGKEIKQGWLRIFQMPDGEELTKIDLGGTINEIMFSADNQYFLAAGHGFLKVFDAVTFRELQSLKTESYFKFVTADFTPDNQFVAGGGGQGKIYVWEWETGELIRQFNYRGRKIESLSWHPSGNYLFTSGHGPYINIFRTAHILSNEDDEVPAAAQVFAGDASEYIDFNEDGSFLVSAHQDGIIRLWVFMGEDPYLNSKRHSWIKKQQAKQNE